MDAGSRRIIEKRNRPPLSCEPCRSRKSKCNRGLPCDSCMKRNHASSCHYAANVRRTEGGLKKGSVTDRLKNLEALVSSFVAQDLVVQPRKRSGTGSVAPTIATPSFPSVEASLTLTLGSSSDDNRPAPNEEPLDLETPRLRQTFDGQVNYLDSSHWLSVLEDIREVREHLSPSEDMLLPDMQGRNAASSESGAQVSSVLDFNRTPDLESILAALPPQSTCDRLLSHYFNSRHLIIGIVHPLKFQKEYEKFWQAPSKAPVLWVALLFAILGVSANFLRFSRASQPDDVSIPLSGPLQRATTECLVLGRYASASAYALETFLLDLQSRFISRGHAGAYLDLWFNMGTVIRLAFRMGYHRDPCQMPGISPFDGEMRRRVWVNLFQIDALMSFQMGFPSMIPSDCCDAQPPRNLEYSDFNPDTAVLPPSRPLTDDTPVRYAIAKTPLMAVFKKIAAHTQAQSLLPSSSPYLTPSTSTSTPPPTTTTATYERTIALDLEARDVYARLPPALRLQHGRPISQSFSFLDPPSRILERCTLELLHLKGLVVLHRRHVRYYDDQNQMQGGQAARFESSRRACVEAALDILMRQDDLHKASLPGGRLHEDKWMLGSLMVHDFLLAAMVVCLDLSVRLRAAAAARDDNGGARHGGQAGGRGDGEDVMLGKEYRALQTSLQVWAARSPLSPEAHTASLALELMIKKVDEKRKSGMGVAQRQETAIAVQPVEIVENSVGDAGLPYADIVSGVIDGQEAPDWVRLKGVRFDKRMTNLWDRAFWTNISRIQIWSRLSRTSRHGAERATYSLTSKTQPDACGRSQP